MDRCRARCAPAPSAWLQAALALLAVVAFSSGVRAQTPEPAPDLGGFEQDAGAQQELPDAPEGEEQSRFELGGSLGLAHSYNYLNHESTTSTNYGGLSMLRLRLALQLDLELPRAWQMRLAGYGFYDAAYRINGRSDYTEDVLDAYEWELDTNEVWVRGSPLEDLDVSFGRQIVNWGSSESLRVVDVLNPLDNREPGMQDLDYLRRPVTMAKLDYYLSRDWSVSSIAIPEIRFSESPAYGSDFFPAFPLLLPPGTPDPLGTLPEDHPGSAIEDTHWGVSLEDMQWAASARGVLRGSDVSLHFARIWDDRLHLDADARGVTFPLPELPPADLRHGQLHVLGASANRALGSWLVKAELAGLEGVEYTLTAPIDTPIGSVRVPAGHTSRWRLDGMLGVEYYGFEDVSFSLELVDRHVFDFERSMREFGGREDQTELALRITSQFLNDRLGVTALLVAVGEPEPDSGFLRLTASYDLRDALVLTLGMIAYHGGSLFPYQEISRNGRLLLGLRYSF